MAARSTGAELVVIDKAREDYPALFDDGEMGSLAEIIEENLGDEGLSTSDMPRIKMPSGGSTVWDMGEDRDPVRSFEGIVIFHDTTRAMYLKSLDKATADEKNNPPDCSSVDGKTGYGEYGVGSEKHPSGDCKTCPLAQFGSDLDGGPGQQCALQKPVWVMLPGEIFPIQVRLSPGSAKAWRTYMATLARSGTRYYSLTTKFALEKAQSQGGVDYARLVVTRGTPLDDATTAVARAYGQQFKEMLAISKAAQVAAASSAPAGSAQAAAAASPDGTPTPGQGGGAPADAWGEVPDEPPTE